MGIAVREAGAVYGVTDEPDDAIVVACYLRRDGVLGVWCTPSLRGDARIGDWLARMAEETAAWGVLTERDLAEL